MSTKIEWVKNPDSTPGETWNPVSGCTKASDDCNQKSYPPELRIKEYPECLEN